MILPIQFKIKENPYYLRYLRSNSYWYKLLNRDSNNFQKFEEEAKRKYKLTKMDRVENIVDTLETIEKIMQAFK